MPMAVMSRHSFGGGSEGRALARRARERQSRGDRGGTRGTRRGADQGTRNRDPSLKPIERHPREGGDPYTLSSRQTSPRQRIWIPASAGMTDGVETVLPSDAGQA